MRYVRARVFPVPAPARTSRGPSVVFAASRCCSFRSLRKFMGCEGLGVPPIGKESILTDAAPRGNATSRAPVVNCRPSIQPGGSFHPSLLEGCAQVDFEIKKRLAFFHEGQIRD